MIWRIIQINQWLYLYIGSEIIFYILWMLYYGFHKINFHKWRLLI